MKTVPTLVALIMIASGSAEASYVDDQSELNLAVSQLRSAIGTRARALKMWVKPDEVTVWAQDPNHLQQVNQWRFVRIVGILPWVFGPEHIEPSFIDSDFYAKLFDLDAVAFSGMSKLEKSAIKRAAIADGVVKQIVIGRTTPTQLFILNGASTGWPNASATPWISGAADPKRLQRNRCSTLATSIGLSSQNWRRTRWLKSLYRMRK